MKCPKCKSESTKVVFTKRDYSRDYDAIRRHVCITCKHRWYAGVPFKIKRKTGVFCPYPVVLEVVTFFGDKGNKVTSKINAPLGVG